MQTVVAPWPSPGFQASVAHAGSTGKRVKSLGVLVGRFTPRRLAAMLRVFPPMGVLDVNACVGRLMGQPGIRRASHFALLLLRSAANMIQMPAKAGVLTGSLPGTHGS